VVKHFEARRRPKAQGGRSAIRDLVTVNGVRVTVEDGSWGAGARVIQQAGAGGGGGKPGVRAARRCARTCSRRWTRPMLRTHPEVGEYNQKI
jgi:phosphomannomutase/phosphoglucomutase